ncbi:MAG: HTTM domain-containing protein [Myxococcales bacterium]|nr:HTTM domain-containing protein [Myxococcales bacterium]
MTLARLCARLGQRVDPASLVVFRVGFGLIGAIAAVRFVALGWVEALLLSPTVHFPWVPWAAIPPARVLYGLFAVQALAGVAIAAGARPRLASGLWLGSFVAVELLDKTLYLNHYVLCTLLGATLLCTPAGSARWRGPRVAAWVLWLLRFEIALVYLWAGIAKVNSDWLLCAEPLTTWLQARAGLPVLGGLLAHDATALAMSWGGAVYDLTVPFLLLWPRTRVIGMGLVLGFHAAVGWLFPIGIFPFVMILGATLLLDPSWPRRWVADAPVPPEPGAAPSALGSATLAAVVLVLALFPARYLWWGTDVAWTERGYRFGWRVLLNEKTGLVEYRIVEPATERTWRLSPSEQLTPLQHQRMRTEPDLIRDYALHLAREHEAEGRDVEVYVDSWAALNGRRSQRFIVPDLDLTQPMTALQAQRWITPLQGSCDRWGDDRQPR